VCVSVCACERVHKCVYVCVHVYIYINTHILLSLCVYCTCCHIPTTVCYSATQTRKTRSPVTRCVTGDAATRDAGCETRATGCGTKVADQLAIRNARGRPRGLLLTERAWQDWGWSVAKMRDMCGIYEFDTKSPFAATLPPWQVEPIFDSVERDFVNGAPAAAMLSSWNAVAELAVRSNIVTAELLQRLVGPSLVWSSWTEHCRKLLHGLVQLHVFFDVKSDSNGMYAYAQAYPLRPPDAMVCNMV
jgi:hypothetical protein